MITLGLTGGIASGKSTVAARLRQLGAAVIDADGITRDLVRPQSAALADIAERFGPGILGPDGALNRAALGNIVFADEEARRDLEAILHPRIWKAALAERQRLGDIGYRVVFYEAALLVETGTYKQLDGLIVVTASPEAQQRRIVARDGHSIVHARARIAAQLPLHEKTKLANWHLDNAGDEADLVRQVDELVKTLEATFGPLTIATGGSGQARTPPAHHLVARYAPVLADQYATLIVGAPSAVALTCAAHLAAPERGRVWLLVPQAAAPALEQWRSVSPAAAHITILTGDPTYLHLGLSSSEYHDLRSALTSIVVIDEPNEQDAPSHQDLMARSVALASNVIALARQAPALGNLTYLSSTFVAGNASGPFLESMPPSAGPFLFDYDERKAKLEHAYAAVRSQLPVVIARASACLDVAEDAVEQLPGNKLLTWMARHPNLPLPSTADAHVHVVDAAYVGEALAALSRHRHAAGKTLHLVADPLPIRTFTALARHQAPGGLRQKLTPWLERAARSPRLAAYVTAISRKTIPASLRPLRAAIFHHQQATALLGPLGLKSRRAEDLVNAVLTPIAGSR